MRDCLSYLKSKSLKHNGAYKLVLDWTVRDRTGWDRRGLAGLASRGVDWKCVGGRGKDRQEWTGKVRSGQDGRGMDWQDWTGAGWLGLDWDGRGNRGR